MERIQKTGGLLKAFLFPESRFHSLLKAIPSLAPHAQLTVYLSNLLLGIVKGFDSPQ